MAGVTGAVPQTVDQRLERLRTDTVAFWDEIQALDFLCGALVVFSGFSVAGFPAPIGIVAAAIISGWAICVRPRQRVRWGGLMLLAGMALFAFLVRVSMTHDMPWTQRITKFVLLLTVAAVLAQRRIDIRSFLLGTMVMSVINAALFYVHLTPNRYPPYLTGFYDDKNVAGMYYALFGLLGLMVLRRWWALAWVLLSCVLVLLTGSRTSISAILLGLAWYALRNRVIPPVRWALVAFGVWLLTLVESQFARIGMFSDRTGTDWFRHQIDVATDAKISSTPWTGLGLNQGFAVLGGDRRVWFHNSYDQAFVEGGWIFVALTLLAFVVLGLGLLSLRRTVPRELLIAEAGIVVILVCGWKLGEVFMTLAGFIALGLAIGARFGYPPLESEGAPVGEPPR